MKRMIHLLLALCCLIIPIEFFAQDSPKPPKQADQFIFESSQKFNAKESASEQYVIPKLSKRSTDLANTFFDYKVLDFDQTKSIRSSIDKKENSGEINSMTFDFGNGEPVNFTFSSSKLFNKDFEAHILTNNGNEVLPFNTNIAFKGIVNGDPNQRVRLTITDEIFYAWYQLNGEEYFVEPLWYMERNQATKSAKSIHVTYSKKDVKPTPHLICGNDDVKEMHDRIPSTKPNQDAEKMMGCAVTDFALAGAFDMIAAYGDAAGVMTKMTAVTNNMAALYVPLDIEYVIVDMVVPTSATADPWFAGGCMDDLLPSFVAWAPGGFAGHDLGQLWVNRDVSRDDANGCTTFGLIGRAAGLGTVCTPTQYNCCEDWVPSNAAAQAHLSAHENGHNWDGEHGDAANANDIMWPSLNSSSPNTVFSVQNTTDMQTHRDSRTCLDACAVCMLVVDCSNITNQTIACRADLPPVDFDLPIIVDSCGPITLSALTIIPGNSGCPLDPLIIPRTYFIQDSDGNMQQCMQTFTVISQVGPTITCPANVGVECGDPIDPSATGMATGTSECGTPTITFLDSEAPACPNTAVITRTWTATDNCGRTATCQQIITTFDTEEPIVPAAPAPITVECDAVPMPEVLMAADACVGMVMGVAEDVITDGVCPNSYLITRTWTFDDQCGNSDQVSQEITVEDTTPPDVTCMEFTMTFDRCGDPIGANTPSGNWITIPASGTFLTAVGGSSIATIDLNGCVTDNCGDFASGGLQYMISDSYEENRIPGCSVDIINEFMIRDICGNVSPTKFNFRGTIMDMELPVVTCADFTETFEGCPDGLGPNTPTGDWFPIPASGMITSTVGAAFTGTLDLSACVMDNCSDLDQMEYSLFASYLGANTGCLIEITNEYQVRDACGNIADDTFIFTGTIQDTEGPDVTCTEYTEMFEGCADPIGPNTPSGNWIAMPASGMITTFVGGVYSSTLDVSGCITDLCSDLGEMEYRLKASSAENRVPGCSVDIINEYEVRDACENVADNTFSFRGTIMDVELPEVTCDEFVETFNRCPDGLGPNTPNGVWFAIGADGGFTTAVGGSSTFFLDLSTCVTDNCTSNANLEVTLHSSYEENRVPGCSVDLINEFNVRDACENVALGRVVFRGQIRFDGDPPVITCPANVTVECLSPTDPTATGMATGTSECGTVEVDWMDDFAPACGMTGTISRTWTATDACGKTSTCVQTIVIEDTTPPEIVCPANVTVSCDESTAPGMGGVGLLTGTSTDMISWNDGTAGFIGMANAAVSGAPAGAIVSDVNINLIMDHSWVGDLNLTLIAPDGTAVNFLDNTTCPTSGNSDNVNATFDDQASGFSCTAISSDTGTPDDCSNDYLGGAGISGSIQPNINSLMAFNGGMVDGDWMLSITDDAGGDGGCLVSFEVEVTWEIPGSGDGTGMATAMDGCSGPPIITFSDVSTQTTTGCGQFTYMITRTWMAVDDCGQVATCVQIINVEDVEGPMITCSPNMTVECEADIVANVDQVVATDNCDIPEVTFVGPILVSGQAGCSGAVYEVTYTATDVCNNTPAVCTQTWTLSNDGPIITCPAPEIVACGEDIVVDPSDVTVVTSCGLTFTTEVFGPNVYDGLPNCPGSRYVYRYLVTDECGRQAVCLREFFIENDAPTVTCMPDQIVTCEDDIITDPEQMITFTTSCDLEADIDVDGPNLVSGVPTCNGAQYDVTYTVTDPCGRSASCTIRWTLSNSGPSITTCAPDRIVECNFDIAAEPELLEIELACGTYEIFPSNIFAINGLGNCPGAQYGITYQVIDECGRSASCTQTWTIENAAPRVIPPDPIIVACLDDVNPNIFDAEAETSCGLAIVQREIFGPLYDEEKPLCTGSVVNYLYSFWDECGRMTCEGQVVTINPGAAAGSSFEDVNADCDILPTAETTLSACGIDYDLTFSDETVLSPGSSDDYKVIRTYSGIDECGITFSFDQTINVKCDGPQQGSSRMCMLSDEGWGDEVYVMDDPLFSQVNVSKENPLVIGFGDRKLVIHDYACVAELLPIPGKPRIFPYDMNVVDLYEEFNCVAELSEPTRKAIYENSLLSQVIALHLNFQVNPESAAIDLRDMCIELDPKIMDELGNNPTIAALFELAEKALSGYYEGNTYRLDQAIRETLNYFTNCPDYPCQPEFNNFGYSDKVPQGFAKFEIYPNPAIDQLNIIVKDVQEELILRVYSTLGEVVYDKTITSSTYDQISIDHLPEGMYHTVLLNNNRVVQTEKFIKVNEK